MWEVVFGEDNWEAQPEDNSRRIPKDGQISHKKYENLRKEWRNWAVYRNGRKNFIRFPSNHKDYDENIFEKNPHLTLIQFKKDFKIQPIAPS